jgi:hypothetical protein
MGELGKPFFTGTCQVVFPGIEFPLEDKMNRRVKFCLVGLMGLAGCSAQDSPIVDSAPSASNQAAAEAATFVSLKVPNMH